MAQPDKWHTHFLLSNFDEAEVQHLGMLELDGAQRPSLTNAVHPIFRQANWVQVRAAHYLQLRPILRLTSHFITNPHLLSYWHALMFGERIEIPRHVAVGPYYAHTLYSFHRIFDVTTNSYALSTLELERTQAALVDLAGAITFTINREPEKLNAVLSTGHDFTSTQTLPVDFGGTPSLIELDRSYVDAYARPDLSISQRLRLQFYIAASLLHEVSSIRPSLFNPAKSRPIAFQDTTSLRFVVWQALTTSSSSPMPLKWPSLLCCRDLQPSKDPTTAGKVINIRRSPSLNGIALPNADSHGKMPSLADERKN